MSPHYCIPKPVAFCLGRCSTSEMPLFPLHLTRSGLTNRKNVQTKFTSGMLSYCVLHGALYTIVKSISIFMSHCRITGEGNCSCHVQCVCVCTWYSIWNLHVLVKHKTSTLILTEHSVMQNWYNQLSSKNPYCKFSLVLDQGKMPSTSEKNQTISPIVAIFPTQNCYLLPCSLFKVTVFLGKM